MLPTLATKKSKNNQEEAAMEAKGANQYNSIIVPSVQEMVKETTINTVPQRYIRSGLDQTALSNESGPRTEIPIIDLNLLSSSTSMASEIDKLDFACKEWGFFQASLKHLNTISKFKPI